MEILKQAMSNQDTVQLVVARRAALTSPSMAALGEEPEEVGVASVVAIVFPELNSNASSGVFPLYIQQKWAWL